MKAIIKKILFKGIPIPRGLRKLIAFLYRVGVCAVEALAFARKLFWVEPVMRSVCEHVGEGFRAERLPYMRGRGRIRLGSRVNLSGRSCFYFPSIDGECPEISIGDETFLGNGCTLSSARRIQIGSHCLIASQVRIHDNDGHPLDPKRRRDGGKITSREVSEVIIGNNVWIGAESLILKGVTIGDNAVVGARSVVTNDVPSLVVVAGNPVRELKRL